MKRLLVIGNGPSLAEIPNEFLASYHSFGGNRIYLKFVPDVYFYVDPIGAETWDWAKDIMALKSIKYIDRVSAPLFPGCTPLNCIHKLGFSYSPLNYIFTYFSVLTPMLQMALYYGYDEVGLIGVDHDYKIEGEYRADQVSDGESDTNHFSADYHTPGTIWKAPRLDLLEKWFSLARNIFDAAGRRIVNLTPGSKLDTFEREDWHTWQK